MPKLAAFPKAFMHALCKDGTMSVSEWITLAAKLDVQGLEWYAGFLEMADEANWARFRREVEAHGMVIPMMCCSPDFTHPDAAFRANEIAKQKRWIDMTHALGGSYCRVLSGQRRPELSIDEGVKFAAESIYACLPYAQERGITLIIENHYKDDFWDYPEFAQKMDVFCQLVEAIDHPNFGVNYDPSNTYLAGEDPLELLKRVSHRVVTMHASDRYMLSTEPDPGLELYHSALEVYPPLTAEEESALIKEVQAGRESAAVDLVRAHLKLVVTIALEHQHMGLPMLDLIGAGNIGLMQAVEKSKLNTGQSFATFAAWWINQSIRRALATREAKRVAKVYPLTTQPNDNLASLTPTPGRINDGFDDPMAQVNRITNFLPPESPTSPKATTATPTVKKGLTQNQLALLADPTTGYSKHLRHGEIGKGLNDYDAIFSELKSKGFNGWISIEDGVDGMDQLQRSVDFLKRKIAQHWPE